MAEVVALEQFLQALPKEGQEWVWQQCPKTPKELNQMLALGVAEESRSEWRSPIVLVPKANGSVRFRVNFRKVNAISRFDASPSG